MSGTHHRRRTSWRDNLEAFTMAVVMALLLKYFVIEAYKIPTGSMQPTLIGDERAGIKDRILVDKLSYVFREPERWEIAIFRYPLDRSKNFVKRIVGVGPEEFRIENGDLWHRANEVEEWRVLRRPASVQAATWKRLDMSAPEESSWLVTTNRADWSVAGRSVRARGSGQAAFRGGREPMVDRYLDGYPESLVEHLPSRSSKGGANAVGDLMVDGEIRALAGTREVALILKEGALHYRFRIPGPAAIEGDGPEIRVQSLGTWGEPDQRFAVALEPFRLPVDRKVRFAVQNLDDLLELRIDDEVVCELEVEPSRNQSSAVFLELEGEGADFDDLMVYRDIYYVSSGTRTVSIPAGHYFMLGDNTQDSSDSREWTFARFGVQDSDETRVVLRGNARRGENPRTVGFGDLDGPKTLLLDEWGESHWFRSGAFERLSPQTAPFVPREMILGKALAVFWPLNPRQGIYRLKWVN